MFKMQGNVVESFLLNNSSDPTILKDMELVINARLEKIRVKSLNFHGVLENYPDAAKKLASKANGLFIWADIACRYLSKCRSEKALKQLLSILDAPDSTEGYLNDDSGWEAIALKGLHGLYISADEPPGSVRSEFADFPC